MLHLILKYISTIIRISSYYNDGGSFFFFFFLLVIRNNYRVLTLYNYRVNYTATKALIKNNIKPFNMVTGYFSAAHSKTAHHSFSAASSSGGGLHTPFPCPSVGSLSQEMVLHEFLQCKSFPRASQTGLSLIPSRGQPFRSRLLQ